MSTTSDGYNFLHILGEGTPTKSRGTFGELEASRSRVIQSLLERMLGEALIARQKLYKRESGGPTMSNEALIAEARKAADEVDAILPGGIKTVEGAVIRRTADALEAVTAERDHLSRLHEVATERTVQLAAVIAEADAMVSRGTVNAVRMHELLRAAPGDVLREWLASKFEPADYYEAKPHKAAADLVRVLRANEGGI